ncbi:MAG: biosynthetic-type acetolactate synthase large subunit [Chitinivibrionia bacterium]|nr:biosynthetic-type acetolactate synthase large subunit [Chitinivibrionia bacterium]
MIQAREMKGSEILIEALRKEKVDVIFGYPGGAVIPIFDAFYDCKDIDVVLTRHEQGAAHAADGYARATGKVGVCLATSGPGATNLVTGIATAYLDSIPMVAITGQVAGALLGTDAFQEADMVGITRSITKHNFLVKDVKDIATTIRKAFYIASTGRPGPVLVDITRDATIATMKEDKIDWCENIDLRSYKPRSAVNLRQVKKAAEAINHAQKPIIYAGGGIILANAEAELLEFAEKTEIPVATTLMGLGAFPANHKQYLGMLGMHGSVAANKALHDSDLIIAIGVRFDDRVTGNTKLFTDRGSAKKATVIHIDIDPAEISKIIDASIPIVGDAKIFLSELNKEVEKGDYSEWAKKIGELTQRERFRYTNCTKVIKPQFVLETLYKETNGDALLITDVGQHQMWSAQYYSFNSPRKFLSSGGLGTMGFGLPAAMGAACGTKGVAWAVCGDGGVQMNIQELATIKLNDIAVKTIVLNNEYLGMVRQWQGMFFGKRYSSVNMKVPSSERSEDGSAGKKTLGAYIPDFVKLAESYGIPARRITNPSEVAAAIKWANETEGAVFLEFMTDPEENVLPMIPAGQTISAMIEDN